MSGIIKCARVSSFFKRSIYKIIYLHDIDKLQLYFLQNGFADCLSNRYISHNFCCGILLWAFKMFSTAPKRFEYRIILNSYNLFDTICKLKKTKIIFFNSLSFQVSKITYRRYTLR